MRILISGAAGLVGTAVDSRLVSAGHTVARLSRSSGPIRAGDVQWNPVSGELDSAAAEGADAVVHLAGASIADGRWTKERKSLLWSSRVDATRRLVAGLANLKQKPRVFIAASAIGYYGSRGDEILTESSAASNDFLANLVREWEAADQDAERASMRLVIFRFGMILSKKGGALARMLVPFRMGVGGRLGSGRQWMSWLTLDDAVGLIQYALAHDELRGVVNAVAPAPVRNSEFTATLARVLNRPAVFPAPPFALRLALGEMADALLLASQRVLPDRLSCLDYPFRHANLAEGLGAVLA
jgi:uncharacterized protein (TIGR01777 family)